MVRMAEALEVHDALVRQKFPSKAAISKAGKLFGEKSYELQKGLANAETYWVSLDMVKLIDHAARSMPIEPLLPIDPISQSGVIMLGIPDVPNQFGRLDILSWAADHEKCASVVWMGGGRMNTRFPVYLEVPFGKPWAAIVGDITHADAQFWSMPLKKADKTRKQAFFMISSFLKAFWTITQQRLTEVVTGNAPRYVRRRLMSSGSPIYNNRVKLIRLRRVTYEALGGSKEVDWTHRWMVDGHWRNQWLPSRETHRLQYILPYVKGPEDKPLVLKRPLNLVIR